MNWKMWLEKWEMTSLKINLRFLQMQWEPKDADKDAAWSLYVELLTRITTQPLAQDEGDLKTALTSVYSLFHITRENIKHYGRDCMEFTKIAVVVLNQVVRPFTAKWHRLSIEGAFEDMIKRTEFRTELEKLQVKLRQYTKMLADMAGVEDLTILENTENQS